MAKKDRLKATIDRIKISGFRSLKKIDLELGNLCVLIGPNGSGKSNFIHFFEMMNWMLVSGKLSEYVLMNGGADDQLYGGNRITPRLEAEIYLKSSTGRTDYRFSLMYGAPDRFFFSEEAYRYSRNTANPGSWVELKGGHEEARILDVASLPTHVHPNGGKTEKILVDFLRNCQVFQFHDTSRQSRMKTFWDVTDCANFRSHGGNLGPILLYLRTFYLENYRIICEQIRRVLPQFRDFDLVDREGKVMLRWQSDLEGKSIGAHVTSDGSLRLFALITLLCLPDHLLPDVILLDEPELGLHPAAIQMVSGLIKSVSHQRQVILATQSSLMVNSYNVDNIYITEYKNSSTSMARLSQDQFQNWLDNDFGPGDLWVKNVFGGRP